MNFINSYIFIFVRLHISLCIQACHCLIFSCLILTLSQFCILKLKTLDLSHMQISPWMCTEQHTCIINPWRTDKFKFKQMDKMPQGKVQWE